MAFNAYIVDAVRTAGGKKNGTLSKVHPTDLGALVLNALVDRNNIKQTELIDDVIFGCVSQIGAQALNVARNCVLSSKLPISVPATTVDRQCGSSLQAIQFAAQAVMSGTQDIVIAGGIEVMSLVQMGSSVSNPAFGKPKGREMEKKWPGIMFSQFTGAEIVAKGANLSREEMEELAVKSHERAYAATKNGHFKNEIIPVPIEDKDGNKKTFAVDEGIRYPIDKSKLSQLPLINPPEGRLTAATASQITDGASAVLIVNERGLQKLGVKPRAKFVGLSVVGTDPVTMLGGPIPATEKVLQKTGLKIEQMDLYEVNEAFASVPLAFLKAFNADPNKLNVNGGAMALGHPLGATGAKLIATLVNELERRNAKYGLLAICEGGGMANAAIIEIIPQNSKL